MFSQSKYIGQACSSWDFCNEQIYSKCPQTSWQSKLIDEMQLLQHSSLYSKAKEGGEASTE